VQTFVAESHIDLHSGVFENFIARTYRRIGMNSGTFSASPLRTRRREFVYLEVLLALAHGAGHLHEAADMETAH